MKNRLLFFIMPTILFQSCEDKNSLKNSLWKYCDNDDSGYVSDILDFRESKYLHVRNDSIFNKENALVATIDRIDSYYGERRLIVKDLKGKTARYCKQ